MIHDGAANGYVSLLKSYAREEGCHTGRERKRGEKKGGWVEFNQSATIILLNHTSEYTFIRHCYKHYKPLIKHFPAFTNCGTPVGINVSNVHQITPLCFTARKRLYQTVFIKSTLILISILFLQIFPKNSCLHVFFI